MQLRKLTRTLELGTIASTKHGVQLMGRPAFSIQFSFVIHVRVDLGVEMAALLVNLGGLLVSAPSWTNPAEEDCTGYDCQSYDNGDDTARNDTGVILLRT